MVHTALAGTVFIVANRPCLPTHYKLYATLQVTLLVHWLPSAYTTHPKEPASSVFACFTRPTASLLVQAKFYPDPLPYPQRNPLIAANAALFVRLRGIAPTLYKTKIE
jgi:hypothetical protein